MEDPETGGAMANTFRAPFGLSADIGPKNELEAGSHVTRTSARQRLFIANP